MSPDLNCDDLRACQALLRGSSKSFAAASLLLPKRVRIPTTVIYAFCRVADDRIDFDPHATLAAVDELRERLERVFRGRPMNNAVDRALAVVVERERLPIEPLEAFLDGLAWDATGRRYETLEDLYAYAARVAGTVGAIMTVLMGQRTANVLARACDLGVAMQLTNIARDVGEDARHGRIYLPLEWMREAGIDPAKWLAEPVADAATRSVVERLLAAAHDLYERGDVGIFALPVDCRMAIAAARLLYADIGRCIEYAGFDSVTRRAVVPRYRKFWLLFRSFRARFMRPRVMDAPPLGPTRFLIQACEETP